MIKLDALKHIDLIDEISLRASGEALIESQLNKIRDKWSEMQFLIVPFENYKDKFKISGIKT